MLKRCSSDEGLAGAAKKCRSDASSADEESDDGSSWAPSSGDEDEECCEHDAIGTRSRVGFMAVPSDMSGINAIMDRVDEDVNRESDFSSESESEEEDEDEGSGESEEESDEEDSDAYSDDDSFVTSDDEFVDPVALVRCDAGIPALDEDAPKDSEFA
jgi:hypothetical protein